MDYTAVLSRIEAIFSGTSGVLLIAGIGVVGIVGAHFMRMRFARTKLNQKSKSYQHVVIAPYVDEDAKDPLEAMVPKFSSTHEQF